MGFLLQYTTIIKHTLILYDFRSMILATTAAAPKVLTELLITVQDSMGNSHTTDEVIPVNLLHVYILRQMVMAPITILILLLVVSYNVIHNSGGTDQTVQIS